MDTQSPQTLAPNSQAPNSQTPNVTDLVRHSGDQPLRRIETFDLMPAEPHYRPRNRSIIRSLVIIGGAVALPFVASVFGVMVGLNSWILICVICLVHMFFARGRHVDSVRKNQLAVNLLNAGRVVEAAKMFDELAIEHEKSPSHPVFVFNRGVAYMLQGELKRAYSLFNAVRRSRQFSYFKKHEQMMHIDMGTCLALMGELEDGQKCAVEARKKVETDGSARIVLLDAILSLRNGDVKSAISIIGHQLPAVEALTREPSRRATYIVFAFALSEAGLRHTDEFNAAISAVSDHYVGEFNWLAAQWPQMYKFLRRHHLS